MNRAQPKTKKKKPKTNNTKLKQHNQTQKADVHVQGPQRQENLHTCAYAASISAERSTVVNILSSFFLVFSVPMLVHIAAAVAFRSECCFSST
jgi:hypothetical protein